MLKDYLVIIFRNFTRRKIRGWLTIIGILIGITAVVSLVSLGQGLQSYVSETFETMGSDKIYVSPGSGIMGSMTTDITLTPKDLSAIENIKGVKMAGGWLFGYSAIKFNGESLTTLAIGLPFGEMREMFEGVQGWEIIQGRDTRQGDNKKAVIGINLYEGEFFDNKVKVRDTIQIKGIDFEVIGVMGRIGNPSDDSQVYITMDDSREIFDEPEDYNFIMVQTAKGADVAAIGEQIEKELRKTRDVEEGDEDFNVQTSEQIMETSMDILGIVQAIVVAIAAISLIVGGVGIMNTMYTSVLERTREIGIMKAIGAKNSDVLIMFLMESGLLGLVGGTMGALFGMGLSKLGEIGAEKAGYGIINVTFSPSLLIGVLVFSFAAGALSGILPAIQASKMRPVEALRYE